MLKIGICLLLLLSIIVLGASASSEPGVTVNWGAFTSPLLEEHGKVLDDGCLLQLVWDADLDGIDEPGERGVPSGGDRLLDICRSRTGSFFPGMLSRNVTLAQINVGDRVYVRAWNAGEIGDATHYGDTRSADPPLWRVDNPISLTVDATRFGSWSTSQLWSPQGTLLWRMENTYSRMLVECNPNPCKGHTRIRFRVPGKKVLGVSDDGDNMMTYSAGSDRVLTEVSVYDASGRLIRVLSREERLPGYHSIEWGGRNASGEAMPSGSYFLRASTKTRDGKRSALTRRLVIVR